MVPITPVVIIGLWSLFGPSRFTMYLAPFIGIGLGILIELLMQVAGRKLSWRLLVITTSSIGLMLVIFFSTISYSAYNDTYGPVVPVTAIKDFLEIKRRVPPHSAMLSWWDNGYPLMTVGEFATYHDNGTHGGIRSTLIAKAITSPRQEDLAAMLSCVEEYGFTRLSSLSVAKNLSGDQLMSLVFNHPINLEKDNVYILYSEDMIKTFGSISMIGTWDFNTKTSRSLGYVPLPYFSRAGNIIHFRGGRIDLDRGRVIDDTTVVPLLAAVFVKDGYMIDRINYTADKGVYLQVLVTKNRFPELQLLEEPTYRSNFNQQFILGNYDRRFFEEVYNNVPLTRLFRVKSTKRP
jgi:dolichyl-diphosphooligosaccharide--protein glycosyltransferase